MGRIGSEHIEFVMKVIVDDEGVSHSDSVRFHRVTLAIVVVANIRVVEVGDHALLAITSSGSQRISATLH